MPTTIVERPGVLSATAFGKESSSAYGTAVSVGTFVPMTSNGIGVDPGLFSPKVMAGLRAANIYPLYGQYKVAGQLAAPLYPTQGVGLLVGTIGQDAAAGSGVTGTSAASPSPTTLSGSAAAGATTITLASASGYAIGDVVQIDANGTGPVTTAECRKISNLVTTTATLDQALTYAHASGAAVKRTQAPYTHSVTESLTLPSYTIESNIGGAESLVFPGTRMNKLDLAVGATNQEASCTYDVISQTATVQPTPTGATIVNESPYVWSEGTVTVLGQQSLAVTSVGLTIDNALKPTYTFNQAHTLQFLTATTLHVTGKCDLVFTSLDDATWGWWTKMVNGTEGTLVLSLAHPSSAGTITLTIQRARIRTYSDKIDMADVVLTTLEFEAFYSLSGGSTVGASVVNSQYLPY